MRIAKAVAKGGDNWFAHLDSWTVRRAYISNTSTNQNDYRIMLCHNKATMFNHARLHTFLTGA